jgi:phytoene desaturase
MSYQTAIVIGAGFGGLAAAVRLRAKGYHVRIVEAADQPGGRARVFRRDGFTFDAGPTVITAPYLIDELFASVGRDARDYYQLVPVDPFYRVTFPDGPHFDYVGEEDRLLEQIAQFHAPDVDGYRRMVAHAQQIFDIGYMQLADSPFGRVSDMLRIVPDLVRLQSYRSVYGLVSRYIRDERLRQVFTFQPLLIGGNPFRAPAIYLLIHWLERRWGVHFPKGGTGAIVQALVALLEELGAELMLSSPVAEIEVEGGRARAVRLESGERLRADLVVCNGDPSTAYPKLIDAKHRSRHSNRAVARKRQSMSLFVGYFGTKKRFPSVQHHTIVLGPRYRGLLADIFDRKVLADDFSLYLHRPTATDPSLAPNGHDGFYVLSPVPNQRSGLDWEQESQPYFDRIIDHLERGQMPGLRDSLVTQFSVDPRYFADELRSRDGAAFGPEPLLRQSAYFRYHNASKDVGDLYFVGAGTHPGAGLPGVLCSAKVLDRVVPNPTHALPIDGNQQQAAE